MIGGTPNFYRSGSKLCPQYSGQCAPDTLAFMATDEIAASYMDSTPESLVVLPFYFPVQILKNDVAGVSEIEKILQKVEDGKASEADADNFVRACDVCTKFYDDANTNRLFMLVYLMTLNGGYLSEEDETFLAELLRVAHVLQECCKKKVIAQVIASDNPLLIRSLISVLWLDFSVDIGNLLIIKGQLQTLRTNTVKTKMPGKQFYLKNIIAACRIIHLLNYASCFARYIYRSYLLKRLTLKQCVSAIMIEDEEYVGLMVNAQIANLDTVIREADSVVLKQILTHSFNYLTTCESSTTAQRYQLLA